MMKFIIKNRIIILILMVFYVIGCNQTTTQNGNLNENKVVDTVKKFINTQKVKQLFYNVPSPYEMSSLLKNAKVEFNLELLNKIENQSKYLTESQISLNFGVFASDLSFARLMDRIQLAVKYLSAIKKISDELGIPPDKGAFAIKRMENNLENKDSILKIVSDLYYYADSYLKGNERAEAAALIVFGGWIEAMYLATNVIDIKNPDKDIVTRIAEQKFSLINLLDLISEYKTNTKINRFIPSLTNLKNIFDKIDVPDVKNETTEKPSKDVSTILVSSEQILEIKNLIAKIRNDVII
jgi:hypothetical protein